MLTDIALTNKFPPAHPPTRPTSNHAEDDTAARDALATSFVLLGDCVVVVPKV